MPDPQQMGFFNPQTQDMFNMEDEAVKMKRLQETLAKHEGEMQNQADSTIKVNDGKALNDVITQAVAPEKATGQESSDGADGGFKKPGKDKLFDVQDLIPTILGAVMGGVIGGPGGAVMGAMGGLYKGQEMRKKSDLTKLGMGNDAERDLANQKYRQEESARRQANSDRQFDQNQESINLRTSESKDNRSNRQKEYEDYMRQADAAGTPPEKRLTPEQFFGRAQPLQESVEDQYSQIKKLKELIKADKQSDSSSSGSSSNVIDLDSMQ